MLFTTCASRALLAGAALATFVLLGASTPQQATAVGGDPAILAPAQGALFGAWTKPRSGRTVQQELLYTEQQIGRRFDIHHLYYHTDKALPSNDMVSAAKSGHIILMSFDPDPINSTPTWQEIARGDQDATLVKRAQELRDFGVPVMLTFDHEADSNIGPFGRAADYVAAYRHVHNVFQSQGATNVIWVWNMRGILFTSTSAADAMYPGDQYVDWVSADAYNWYPGKRGSTWRSFADSFEPFHQWASRNHPDKPQMAVETGVQEDTATPDAGRKAAWIRDMAATLKSWPEMKGVVWFNSDKIYPWWYDSSAASLNAFKDVGQDCYFRPRDTSCTGGGGGGAPDTAAPSTPANVTASSITSTSFVLSWSASTDDTGVSRYHVYVDGAKVSSTQGLSISVTGVECSAGCQVAVEAEDGAGNVSPRATTTVRTVPPVVDGTASGLVVTRIPLQVKIAFVLSGRTTVSIVVANSAGTIVTHKLTNAVLPAGPQTVYWKLKDDNGRLVPGGIYSVRLITGTGGSISSSLTAFFRL
jgi:glycosyl hydrolase family 26